MCSVPEVVLFASISPLNETLFRLGSCEGIENSVAFHIRGGDTMKGSYDNKGNYIPVWPAESAYGPFPTSFYVHTALLAMISAVLENMFSSRISNTQHVNISNIRV